MSRKLPSPSASDKKKKSFWLYGKHPVISALKNKSRICKRLLVTRNTHSQITSLLEEEKIKLSPEIVSPAAFLQHLPEDAVHQGIALLCDPLPSLSLEQCLESLAEKQTALIVALDQITDPHNVGAIFRSAAAFGASAILTPQHHTVTETGTLAKSACGALELLPIIHVTNLAQALQTLKEHSFWCLGLDGYAKTTLDQAPSYEKTVLLLGAEGKGMRRLTREHCDLLLTIPIHSQMESLNVSNAAAIALYQIQQNAQ